MFSRTKILLVLVVLAIMPLSCTKIPEPSIAVKGGLGTKALPYRDSIPLNWGNLVSVTNVAEYPYWLQLWFQDKNGTIRIVAYSARNNSFSKDFKLIHRKEGG